MKLLTYTIYFLKYAIYLIRLLLWKLTHHPRRQNTLYSILYTRSSRSRYFLLFTTTILVTLAPLAYYTATRPNQAQSAWYSTGGTWLYRKAITLESDQVSGASNLTNFPVLISVTDSDLQANAQADGDDILFTSADGSTKLSHEIERYDSGTGELIAWVKIPTLSYNTDTTIYLYYGESAVSSQQDATNVWDSNFKMVHHLEETTTGATDFKDSTANGHDSTAVTIDGAGSNADATGKIGSAVQFDGSNDEITMADHADFDITTAVTIEAWIDLDSFGESGSGSIIDKDYTTSWSFYPEDTVDELFFEWDNGSARLDSNNSVVTTGAGLQHVVVVYDQSNVDFYVDGVDQGGGAETGSISTNAVDPVIGGGANSTDFNFDGIIDEIRFSNTNRSPGWIITSYNTQNTPGTFATFGSAEMEVEGGNSELKAWIKFDEGVDDTCGSSNDACDSSLSNIDAAFNNNPTWQSESQCIQNKCVSLDGSDDNIVLLNQDEIDLDTDLASGFTIAGWVKVNSDGENDVGKIFWKGTNTYLRVSNQGSGMVDVEASLNLATTNATTTITDGLTLNQWHHIAMSYTDDSDDEISIYIDGRLASTSTNGVGSPDSDSFNLLIGGDSSANFHGFVDDFRVYQNERTAQEVKSLSIPGSGENGSGAVFGAIDYAFLSENLVSYWPMDDNVSGNSQTITDKSGQGEDNTTDYGGNTSGMDCTIPGKYGFACDMDGTDDELDNTTYTQLNGQSQMTVSTWIDIDSAQSSEEYLFHKDSQFDIRVDDDANTVAFSLNAGSYTVWRPSVTLPTDTWFNLTVTYDGEYQRIYINGELQASNSKSGSIANGSGQLTVGDFNGQIDESRVYTRALSPGEVKSLYQWSPPPIGHWSLDENSGTTTAFDRSGNSNNMTMTGSMTNQDWVPGKFGSALSFDGEDDYLTQAYDGDFDTGIGEFTVSGWFNVDSAVTGSGGASGSQTVSVAASADDAEETISSGNMSLTSSDLELIDDATGSGPQEVGVRFLSIDAPPGSNISNAQIVFTGDANDSGTTNLVIYGEDEDDAGTFTSSNSDITDRTKTSTSVNWSSIPAWSTSEVSADTTTPDLSSIMQEIINRPGWAADNDMVFIFTGSGERTAVSYNGGSSDAAELSYDYSGSTEGYLVSRYDNDQGYKVWIDYTTGYVSFGIDDDGTWDPDDTATTSTDYKDGSWHHFSAVKTSSAIYLYIDGQLAASDTSLAATGTLTSNSAPLSFGSDEPTNGNYLEGMLDDIRIYNYARSAGQVVEDLNAGHPLGGSPIGSQVAYLKFDENYGDTANDSVGGYNGDLASSGTTCPDTGGCPTWVDGKIDKALDFDNSDDHVNLGDVLDLAGNQPMSVTAWINPDTVPATNYDVIVGKLDRGTAGVWRLSLVNPSGTLEFLRECGSYGTITTETIPTDTWTHVAGTYDGTYLRIYINGKLVKTAEDSCSTFDQTTDLIIGAGDNGGGVEDVFDGSIDEVKIYSAALTDEQVRIDMSANSTSNFGTGYKQSNAASTGSANSPTLYLPLNENTGSSAYDLSGNGFNGTLNNGGWNSNCFAGSCFSTTINGTRDYIEVSDPAGGELDFSNSDDFSISTWIRYTSDETNTYFISKGGTSTSDAGYSLYTISDFIRCYYTDGNGSGFDAATSSAYTLQDGEWHHIACVVDRDGNQIGTAGIHLFIDGVLQGSDTSLTEGDSSNTSNLSIGEDSTSREITGAVDEVKIFDYALTHDQVDYDYDEGKPMIYYKFDECSGTTINNSSFYTTTASWSGASGSNTSAGTCNSAAGNEAWDNGTTGKFNSSLDFDGDDDLVSVTNNYLIDLNQGLANGFTIAAWINADSDGESDAGEIFEKGSTTYCRTTNETAGVMDLTCRLNLITSDSNLTVSSALNINTWHHIALSWTNDSDDEITVWVDGVPTTSTGYSGNTFSESSTMSIGGSTGTTFDGQIDDFRIYDRELSASEINRVINQGSGVRFGPETGSP